MIGHNQMYEVLFTRQNLDSITERFATYIVQRQMGVDAAWKQAVEDEAQLIEHKLELMEEGSLEWDWSSRQVKAVKWMMQTEKLATT